MTCNVCRGVNKIAIQVIEKTESNGVYFDLPVRKSFPCPQCEAIRRDEQEIILRDEMKKQVGIALSRNIAERGGLRSVATFKCNHTLQTQAKTDPQEFFQRMLTAFMDEIKLDLFNSATYRVVKDEESNLLLEMSVIFPIPSTDSEWQSIDDFDQTIRKVIR